MNEYIKSVKAILYDRITSPFYGTLIISWLLWNWKIPYVTFFISEEVLADNKIDYIIDNCTSISHLLWFPLASVVVLLTIIPFITNGAYWLSLKFDKWRYDKRAEIENKQLLTIEQSLSLRMEMREQEERFGRIMSNKEQELKDKNAEIEFYQNKISELNILLENSKDEKISKGLNYTDNDKEEMFRNEYEVFKNDTDAFKYFDKLIEDIQLDRDIRNELPIDIINYLDVSSIIKKGSKGIFELTEKGKYFLKFRVKETLNKSKW